MARAIAEYEKQHTVAVDAAWQAATAKPGDQLTTPSLARADSLHELSAVSRTGVPLTAEGPTTEEKETEQPASGTTTESLVQAEALPMAKHDDMAKETAEAASTEESKETKLPASGAVATKAGHPVHASLAWDLSPAAKPKSMENPLAGLPPKPHCSHCNSLLLDGRCVNPDCGKDQDVTKK